MLIWENKKILFLIHSPLFTKGGHSKNFLNLLKYLAPLIKENGIQANIVSINNSPEAKDRNEREILAYDYLDVYNISFLKRLFPSGKLLYQGLEFIVNLLNMFVLLSKIKPDIVYCYADKPLLIMSKFKRLFNFKIVYDMRGDTVNEMKVQGNNKLKVFLTERNLLKALVRTDLVFTVSREYKTNIVNCIEPKYNYYDGDIFEYNQELAKIKKVELGLQDKFVFVYTGNAHYYQMIEETIRFFGQFYLLHKDAYLIIITEYEQDYFKKLLDYNKVPNSAYFIKSLPQAKISDIQCVADMGLLLRADLPLNHHAFPTKFAEYLACGVPVLTTPHIHSISPMVLENNLGEVISLKEDYTTEIELIYSKYKHNYNLKQHCNSIANSELMWQIKAKDIFNLINNVE